MVSSKIIAFFAATLCVVGLVNCDVATKLCKSQLDCRPTECCSKRIFEFEAYCVQRRQLNEICISDELGSTMTNGLYDITCPCADDLKCIQEKYMANGVIYSLGIARCRKPNYPGYAGFAYANANAQSNSAGYSDSSYASANSNAYA